MINILKYTNLKYIVFTFIAGVFLMLLPSENPKSEESYNYEISDKALKNKVSKILKDTYKLDYANVIITYDTSGEKVLEYDYEQTITENENKYLRNSVNDKSSNKPFVKSEKLPDVRGVLVSVAPADEILCTEIRRAVATLLGTPVNRVNVISGKE